MILLDTDTLIEILLGDQQVIDKRLETDERVALSFMTVGELCCGAGKSRNRMSNTLLVDEFLLFIKVIHTDIDISKKIWGS